ncbi:Murein hydrolase activator NlpD [hydrothermal vent metagenome]|uniref:Murein hydrolase activator NlpD n=1 Tax=hydrothermal vent metagenome TaxID=652676 RepID=A0A3B0Y158_9ZZZZ
MPFKISGAFFLFIVFVLLSACGEAPVRWDPLGYTVKRGDTLYSIAWRYEKDFRQVAEWNNISSPYAIFPGQRLVMQASTQNGSASNEQRPQVVFEAETGKAIVSEVAGSPVKQPAGNRHEKHPEERPLQVAVKKNETLYAISQREGYSLYQLARWNQLKSPYVLKPGQILRLTPPVYSLGSTHRPVVRKDKITVAVLHPPRATHKSPNADSGKQDPHTAPSKHASLPRRVSSWQWPVKGRVVKSFKASDTARKGIGIQGRPGQSVKAAAAGTVVYSGNGLINYGNLIIIKHSHSFLSAYAYNKSLLVKEGDSVKSGQAIAKMGASGSSSSQLHFEIRRNGKPVNPLQYLPKS